MIIQLTINPTGTTIIQPDRDYYRSGMRVIIKVSSRRTRVIHESVYQGNVRRALQWHRSPSVRVSVSGVQQPCHAGVGGIQWGKIAII
jgi:hypothetical protein